MAKYTSTSGMGGNAVASAAKTAIEVVGVAARRGKIYELKGGATGATLVDEMQTIIIIRESTAGTASAITPNPIDATDADTTKPVALLAAQGAFTVEPTTTQILDEFGLHVRSTYAFQFKTGSELVVPAGANLGIGVQLLSATYVGNSRWTLSHEE